MDEFAGLDTDEAVGAGEASLSSPPSQPLPLPQPFMGEFAGLDRRGGGGGLSLHGLQAGATPGRPLSPPPFTGARILVRVDLAPAALIREGLLLGPCRACAAGAAAAAAPQGRASLFRVP